MSALFISQPAKAFNYGSGPYGECLYGGEIGDDALTFSVNTSSVSLSPNLSPSATATGTATFAATQFCSDAGYVVTISGNSLNRPGHTITNLTSPTASSAGTEQYGINLVDNATPNIGANPSGGTGAAAAGFNTADQFKYISGNTIATETDYSPTTTYTISFIANVNSATPAGSYTTTHRLICTTTY